MDNPAAPNSNSSTLPAFMRAEENPPPPTSTTTTTTTTVTPPTPPGPPTTPPHFDPPTSSATPPPPPPPPPSANIISPQKKWGTGALAGAAAAVLLVIVSVITAVTLYNRRNQSISPIAPPPGQAFSNIKESGNYPDDTTNHFGFDGNCFTLHLDTINTTKFSCAGKTETDSAWTASSCDRNQIGGHADPALRCFTANYCGVQKIIASDGSVTTDRVKVNSGPDCNGTLSWSINQTLTGFEVDVSGSHDAFVVVVDFGDGAPSPWQNPQTYNHAAGTGPTTYAFTYSSPPPATPLLRIRVTYNDQQVQQFEQPPLTISPSPTPTAGPTPTPPAGTAACQNIKVFRNTTEIQTADIRLNDTIIFRGFASSTGTTVSKIRFTLTKGGVAQVPVEMDTTLVAGLYQADYQITADVATSYSVTAVTISP